MTLSPFVVAGALNWLVAAALFGVGVRYLVARELMPHHLEILDAPWADVSPRARVLMMILMKGTGMVAICTAVSLAVLLAVPFRLREGWSRWAILLVGATALVPTLIGAVRVYMQTGVSSAWWPHLALLAALGLAFWLTGDFGRPA